MSKAELRTEPRVAKGRKATLIVAGVSVPCVIQDISTKGFLVMCTKPFAAGDVLELKCELYPGRFLSCKIQVRHVSDMCLGTQIVEIHDTEKRLCLEFLEEHYADRLKFG